MSGREEDRLMADVSGRGRDNLRDGRERGREVMNGGFEKRTMRVFS